MLTYFRRIYRRVIAEPTGTILGVLALALGIGVNVACFTSVDAMVIRPYPFPHADQLLRVWERSEQYPKEKKLLSLGDYVDYTREAKGMLQLAAYRRASFSPSDSGGARQVRAAMVTPEFFSVLGLDAAKGRTLSDDADFANGREVVLSHAFWQEALSSRADAVGSPVSLGGSAYTIVGVMPASFDFPLGVDVWLPLVLTPQESTARLDHTVEVVARRSGSVSRAEAESALQNIARRIAKEWPDTNKNVTVSMTSLSDMPEELTQRFVYMLLGSATFVLLLACANVSNIGLLRAVAQQRRTAVRIALGATRWAVMREAITDSVILSLVAGVLGILVAAANLRMTRDHIPPAIFSLVQGLKGMHITWDAALYTVGISIVAGLFCAIPSMLFALRQVSDSRLGETLTSEGLGSGVGRMGNRFQSAVVALEICMALMLLLGASFMYKTFGRMVHESVGFNTDHLLTADLALPAHGYDSQDAVRTYYTRLLHDVSQLPGVEHGAVSGFVGGNVTFGVPGRPLTAADVQPAVKSVSAEFLESTQIPLMRGRSLSLNDTADGRKVALVSASVARYYWPTGDPLLKTIFVGGTRFAVVGVIGDVKNWFGNNPSPLVYVSSSQYPVSGAQLLVRTAQAPDALMHSIAVTVGALDTHVTINSLESYEQVRKEQTSGVQVAMMQMTTYGVMAFVLSIAGIYSITAYRSTLRTREIGLRLALGADRKNIFILCLRMSQVVVLLGTACGLAGGIAMNGVLAHVIPGSASPHFGEIAAVALMLLVAICVAVAIPARRAMSIEPVIALKT